MDREVEETTGWTPFHGVVPVSIDTNGPSRPKHWCHTLPFMLLQAGRGAGRTSECRSMKISGISTATDHVVETVLNIRIRHPKQSVKGRPPEPTATPSGPCPARGVGARI